MSKFKEFCEKLPEGLTYVHTGDRDISFVEVDDKTQSPRTLLFYDRAENGQQLPEDKFSQALQLARDNVVQGHKTLYIRQDNLNITGETDLNGPYRYNAETHEWEK